MNKPRWTVDEFRELVADDERRASTTMVGVGVVSLAMAAVAPWPLLRHLPPEILPDSDPLASYAKLGVGLIPIFFLLGLLVWLRYRAMYPPAQCSQCECDLVNRCSLVIATRNCPLCGGAQLEELPGVEGSVKERAS